MDVSTIRTKFLEFFKERGHTLVSSSSLIPQDPSVLLTTAGMQQFKQYFTREKDPMADFGSHRTASVQKCFRTTDIEEIGDERHLTFFEMLGNFSFGPIEVDDPSAYGSGGYFKKAAIHWAHEFITQVLGLEIEYVSVFAGDDRVPFDSASFAIWKELGFNDDRIVRASRQDNFWGPTGDEGPCGPTTELYLDGIEVWNLVFNEYYQKAEGTLEPLSFSGVDTGMGLERLLKVVQKSSTIFETDLFVQLTRALRPLIPSEFHDDLRSQRIILDHLRGIAFLIADGVRPSNTDRGYILRRLIRRLVLRLTKLHIPEKGSVILFKNLSLQYGQWYPHLKDHELIHTVFSDEAKKFKDVLVRGIKTFEKSVAPTADATQLAQCFFRLFESSGLPFEIAKELASDRGIEVTREVDQHFEELFEAHREISKGHGQ